MHPTKPSNLHIAFSFGLVYLFWGSTFLAIRIAVQHMPPAVMTASRFLLSGALMLGWCALRGARIKVDGGNLLRLLLLGSLLLVGGNTVVAWSEQWVPSGLTALVLAITPLWVAVIESWILKGDRLSRRGLLGLGLGIAGIVVLLWPEIRAGWSIGRQELIAAATLNVAAISWATGSILSRRWTLPVDNFAASGWEMFLAGAVNFFLAMAARDFPKTHWSGRGFGAVFYLVIAGSLIGFTAYTWLLEHVPTAKVATYAYVNPVVAVFLGWLLLHERIDGYIWTGMVIIVISVALVTTSKLKSGVTEAERDMAACEASAD